MPTLLEEPALQTVEETLLEEFDLERLARLSEPQPAIEPPHFALLEPPSRFRLRRTLLVAFLAAVVVAGLATLRPDVQATYTPAASQAGGATTDAACPVAD